jgi:hypothetical protein
MSLPGGGGIAGPSDPARPSLDGARRRSKAPTASTVLDGMTALTASTVLDGMTALTASTVLDGMTALTASTAFDGSTAPTASTSHAASRPASRRVSGTGLLLAGSYA